MQESTQKALQLAKAKALPRADGPYSCIECGVGIRTPRILRTGKIEYRCRMRLGTHADEAFPETITSMVWCSQECHDAWAARLHLPGPHWPVYHDGELIAYVVPGKGRVPVGDFS